MTDRIADPWGERTPFPKDGEWPVRVDKYLEEGVSEGEVDRWVRSASLLHSNGDALDIAIKDGRIVGVRGRAVDRVNKGRLDPKDLCPASSPRHALIGHAVAVGAGTFALAVFGLLDDPTFSPRTQPRPVSRRVPCPWRSRASCCCS